VFVRFDHVASFNRKRGSTAARMAAHRKLDQRRDDLCFGESHRRGLNAQLLAAVLELDVLLILDYGIGFELDEPVGVYKP
jgi:hypothetical protein